MVPSITRQAVMLKCRSENNTILADYECAYGIGFILKLSGNQLPEYKNMTQLLEKTKIILESYTPADEKEKQLIRMLELYVPKDTESEQINDLLMMGINENRPWIV